MRVYICGTSLPRHMYFNYFLHQHAGVVFSLHQGSPFVPSLQCACACLWTCVCACVCVNGLVGGLTGGRDGWPGTETVLTTSEYGVTLQKGQLLLCTHPHTRAHAHTLTHSLTKTCQEWKCGRCSKCVNLLSGMV